MAVLPLVPLAHALECNPDDSSHVVVTSGTGGTGGAPAARPQYVVIAVEPRRVRGRSATVEASPLPSPLGASAAPSSTRSTRVASLHYGHFDPPHPGSAKSQCRSRLGAASSGKTSTPCRASTPCTRRRAHLDTVHFDAGRELGGEQHERGELAGKHRRLAGPRRGAPRCRAPRVQRREQRRRARARRAVRTSPPASLVRVMLPDDRTLLGPSGNGSASMDQKWTACGAIPAQGRTHAPFPCASDDVCG